MATDGSNVANNWKDLARAAIDENDPAKFTLIITDLCAALDEQERLRNLHAKSQQS
jgi:hypothetical protein